MIDYAVCEIAGKQYKVVPGQSLTVAGQLSAKVLLLAENGKIKVGHPYLKENLNLKSLGEVKGEKVRVAKFHAKANYRKVTGYRKKFLKVVLDI
ncbi:50S ribosomal protein L21 [Candidatus Daviesbacteria bacterium]|nr:50S ribosomal protein L21 [Candidatus Daviesbacteria bacterium]